MLCAQQDSINTWLRIDAGEAHKKLLGTLALHHQEKKYIIEFQIHGNHASFQVGRKRHHFRIFADDWLWHKQARCKFFRFCRAFPGKIYKL